MLEKRKKKKEIPETERLDVKFANTEKEIQLVVRRFFE